MDPETLRRVKVIAVVLILGGVVAGFLMLRERRREAEDEARASLRRAEEAAIAAHGANRARQEARDEVSGADPGRVRIEEAEVPARFLAPLPATAAELEAWDARFPPRVQVQARLCAGDGRTWGQLLEALRKLEASGASEDAVAGYGELLKYCGRESQCQRVRQHLGAERSPAVRSALYRGLADCRTPEDRALFERPDAPAQAVVDWVMGGFGQPPGFFPRLASAAREILARGEVFPTRLAAVALGNQDDPRAAAALLALHAEAGTPELKRAVAFGMYRQSAPRAKAAFAAACRAAGERPDALCPAAEGSPGRALERPDPAVDPDAFAEGGWAELEAVERLAPEVRGRVIAALERCAQTRDAREPWRQARCLASLSGLDRPRAVACARALLVGSAGLAGENAARLDERLAGLVRSLVRYPGADDLGRKLQEVGLLPAGPLPAGAASAASAREVLEAAGRVHSFDTETGQFPNEHDRLLAELAAMAGPPLSTAVFEEQPPPDVEERSGRPYVLRGYLGGKRFTIEAEDLGDWYDVEAVLLLLEAMLRDQGSPLRLVPLPTGDQTAAILVAEGAALERAASEDLLELGDPGEGEARGKAFEDEVMRKLQSGELRLGEE